MIYRAILFAVVVCLGASIVAAAPFVPVNQMLEFKPKTIKENTVTINLQHSSFLGEDGVMLQVVLEGDGAKEKINYSEVGVVIKTTAGIAVKITKWLSKSSDGIERPSEHKYFSSNENRRWGRYDFRANAKESLDSIAITWKGETVTFSIAEGKIIGPYTGSRPFVDFHFPEKTIHGTALALSLRPINKEDELTLAVLFRSNDDIKYDDVKVSATDTDGKAMRVIPSGKNNGGFWDVANWKQGHYQFFVMGGQEMSSIKVKWKGEEVTFLRSEGQGMAIEGLLLLDKWTP